MRRAAAGTGNNGNVTGYWYDDPVNTSFSHTASYGYDNVNRLSAACTLSGSVCATSGSNVYNLAFGYDSYSNMNCTGGVGGGSAIGFCPNWSYNTATNQINISGLTYDAAGNLTADGTGTHSYQWDAEGRLKSVDNGSTASYVYNALGQRVEKQAGTAYTEYFDDASGEPVGENNRTGWTLSVVPLGGHHLAHCIRTLR